MKPYLLALAAFLLYMPLSAAATTVATTTAAATDANPFEIDDKLDAAIRTGLQQLYNLDFDQAIKTFDSIKDRAEEHPMVAFGDASAQWWRVSAFVLDADEKETAAFQKSVDRCVEVSEKKIKAGDPDREGRLCLGGAYGLIGRMDAANHRWFSAYVRGKKAYKILNQTLEINPKMVDAYVGKGIFDFYIATLPSVVRALAFIGSEKDPQVGLNELQIASERGTYARTSADLFLVQIYSGKAKTPEKGLKILENLQKDYPKSSFMQMLEILALYNIGDEARLQAEAESFAKKVDSGFYAPAFKGNAYFALGIARFKVKDWDGAIAQFDKAIATNDEMNPFRTWAFQYKGYALDALGKRDEAVTQYKEILKRLRRWGSHDNAEEAIKKPFVPTTESLATLQL